jgi:RND family efflux transporter MFP subunit
MATWFTRRRVVTGLVALAVVGALASAVTLRAVRKANEGNGQGAPVTLQFAAADLTYVEARPLARWLPVSGTLQPVRQAIVKAKVAGDVRQVNVREGESVRAGQVLARIDTTDLESKLIDRVGALESAKAQLALAEKTRSMNVRLLNDKFISQNAFDSAESSYNVARGNVKSMEAQLQLARNALKDADAVSPLSGIVAKRHVQPGEKVSPDSTIVTLVDLRQMVLEAAVPAADIPSVSIGQRARFKVGGFGGREFDGEVQRINPITADGSRAIMVYIAVPNPNQALKGGMFAQGALTLDNGSPVLAVPQRAVHEDAGAAYVYTLRDDKIARTPVKVGPAMPGSAFVEVRAGLAAGDSVIVTEITAEQVGQRVIVRGATAPALTANG